VGRLWADPWDSAQRRCGASDRARQNVQPSRGGSLVDRERRQQQSSTLPSTEQPVAAALALDRVRVGLVAEIASDGQALTSNRRRAVELELQQA